jgi:Predicted membrane protein
MSQSNTSIAPKKRKSFFNPVSLFLVFGILIGLLYCIFIPYGAGFDEEQHVARIFDLAGFHLLPNRSSPVGTPLYADFMLLSYQRRYFETPAWDLLSKDIFFKPIDITNTVGFPTRSIYSPVIFIPQALIARIFWRKYNFPVIPIAILCRIAGLLIYLAGSYFTIRLLPVGKWVFMALALSPMALFQASTLNADGFTNAVCFMFIGVTLAIFVDQASPIRSWKIWSLAGIILLLGFAKPDAVLLLPLLLILPFRRFRSKGLVGVIGLGVVLAIIFTVVWNVLALKGSDYSVGGVQSISHQMQLALANPVNFLVTYVRGNLMAVGGYYKDWVAAYGYWVGTVPVIIYWLYPLVLLSALLVEPRSERFSIKNRIFVAAVFLFASAATAGMYFYVHYSPNGDTSFLGRQGRYYILTAPLLFLAFSGLVSVGERWVKLTKVMTVSLLGLVLGFYSYGLYATYYTDCGASLYTHKPCVQPIYKNLDVSSTAPQAYVNKTSTLSQGFTSVCGKVAAVDVKVSSIPEAVQGTLHFSLLDGGGQTLSSKDFAISNMQAGSDLRLSLSSSLVQAKGTKYEIRLESQDVLSPPGIGIAISDSNHYREGDFTAAGIKQYADLIFHYTCLNP